MKRTAVLLSLVSTLGVLAIACGGSPDTLSNESADSKGTIGGDTDDDNDPKSSTDQTDPKPAASTSASSNTTAPPAKTTSSNTAACDPNAAKTAADCTKCCAEKASPATTKAANDCACGTSSKCAGACGDNLCQGDFPSFECGACMFQAQCDFGDLGADLGGLAGGDDSDSAACFKICEAKP
jgi:hypothetical protein